MLDSLAELGIDLVKVFAALGVGVLIGLVLDLMSDRDDDDDDFDDGDVLPVPGVVFGAG